MTLQRDAPEEGDHVLERAIADQLAWDRFAAGAPINDVSGYTEQYGKDWIAYVAHDAACFADAMMAERAKRMKP